MTELELIAHAKHYMDRLAAGVDPISGQAVPGDSVLSNPRLERCFAYVSTVLERVIGQGGFRPAHKIRYSDVSLTAEQISALRPADRPITIMQFVTMVKALIGDPKEVRLPARVFTDWLLEKGFLRVETDAEGKNHRIPTEAGTALGLMEEHRSGDRGDYRIIYYSAAAQQFLIDHLHEILPVEGRGN